ncbi:unnamed protein product [Rhizophagus irregularis]|nr:unnamed protein product [Rhizophagus irregularis]
MEIIFDEQGVQIKLSTEEMNRRINLMIKMSDIKKGDINKRDWLCKDKMIYGKIFRKYENTNENIKIDNPPIKNETLELNVK